MFIIENTKWSLNLSNRKYKYSVNVINENHIICIEC